MTILRASETRIPPDTFNRVAYQGDRVRIERRGGASVVVISEEDARMLEALEDRYWADIADEGIADMEARGEKPVPLSKVKAKLKS